MSSIACAASSAGADDYVCKPFSLPGAARAGRRAAAPRRRAPAPGRLRVGALEIDAGRAGGAGCGSAGRAVAEGVRAAARRWRPSPRGCSPRRSCCATSGASGRMGTHAHARLARVPAAPQARRRTATGSWSTSGAWATAWSTGPAECRRRCAALAAVMAACRSGGRRPLARRCSARGWWRGRPCAGPSDRLRRRRELVARACHELRGPLTAARLALHAAMRQGDAAARALAAIDLSWAAPASPSRTSRAHVAGPCAGPRRARRRRRPARREARTWRMVDGVARPLGSSSSSPRCRGVIVRGDASALAQAVGNLVANALEHGGGRVELRRTRARAAGCASRSPTRVQGCPRAVGELARRPRAGRGRRGRGLAIAADIADRHGGRLVAAPTARGARVALELPAWRDPRSDDAPPPRRRAAGLALLLGALAASDVAGREAALRRQLGPTVRVVVVRAPPARGRAHLARGARAPRGARRYAPPGALARSRGRRGSARRGGDRARHRSRRPRCSAGADAGSRPGPVLRRGERAARPRRGRRRGRRGRPARASTCSSPATGATARRARRAGPGGRRGARRAPAAGRPAAADDAADCRACWRRCA